MEMSKEDPTHTHLHNDNSSCIVQIPQQVSF